MFSKALGDLGVVWEPVPKTIWYSRSFWWNRSGMLRIWFSVTFCLENQAEISVSNVSRDGGKFKDLPLAEQKLEHRNFPIHSFPIWKIHPKRSRFENSTGLWECVGKIHNYMGLTRQYVSLKCPLICPHRPRNPRDINSVATPSFIFK